MIALIWYTFATMFHSQRYLAPVLLFMGVLGVLSSHDPEPLLPIYATAAGVLFLSSTWFTIALVSHQDPGHRALTVVASGQSVRVLLAATAVAVLSGLVLDLAGLGYPLLVAKHTITVQILTIGAIAELTAVFVGVTIGLLCSRLTIRRPGYALAAALGLVLVALLVPGLPPVNATFRLLATGVASAQVLRSAVGYLAVAALLLVAGVALTQFVAERRD